MKPEQFRTHRQQYKKRQNQKAGSFALPGYGRPGRKNVSVVSLLILPTSALTLTVLLSWTARTRGLAKNMITGASQADAAIIVVAAPDGDGTDQEHVFL